MKSLFSISFFNILLGVLSLALNAQASDGFHSLTIPSCSGDSCVVVDGKEIGLVYGEEYEGGSYTELNVNSTLIDVFENHKSACYSGSALDAVKVLKLLSSQGYAQYYHGGHENSSVEISLLTDKNGEVEVSMLAQVQSDYMDFTIKALLPKCR